MLKTTSLVLPFIAATLFPLLNFPSVPTYIWFKFINKHQIYGGQIDTIRALGLLYGTPFPIKSARFARETDAEENVRRSPEGHYL